MQILIDIPEKVKDNFVKRGFDKGVVAQIIENGIIIPKGHGRLIDADKLIKKLEATANIEWNKQVLSSKGLEDAIDIVDESSTIIEADKESD